MTRPQHRRRARRAMDGTRGFTGRRGQRGAGLISPGQYVVDEFPVLTADPRTSTDVWELTVSGEVDWAALDVGRVQVAATGADHRRHPLHHPLVELATSLQTLQELESLPPTQRASYSRDTG